MAQLTAERIIHVLGRDTVDDHTIVSIIATGASEEEFVEAYGFVTRGDELGAELARAPSGRIAALCEILVELYPETDEDKRVT